TRFTFDPADDGNPVWSPDGTHVVWDSNRGGADGLWMKSANGMGAEQMIVKSPGSGGPTDWSPDGRFLLFMGFTDRGDVDGFEIPMRGADPKPRPLLASPFSEIRAKFSRDGRWLAYESNESGRSEIYVASLDGTAGKWQISTNGGSDPAWS